MAANWTTSEGTQMNGVWAEGNKGGFGEVGKFFGPRQTKQPTYGSHYQVPHYSDQYTQYGRLANSYDDRNAPRANAYTAGESGFRGNQSQLAHMLMRQAQGHGPGQKLVRMQAQQAADRGMQQQMAMANSGRPGMGAMGARNAMMNSGNIQSQVGGQAAMAGLQAQLGATNQLGSVLQGARGQDLQRGMFNAGQQQQGSQFNADAQLRQMGLNDQAQLEALRQRLQLGGMQQQGGLTYEQLLAQHRLGKMGQPTFGQQLMSGGASLGAAYLGAGGGQAAQSGGGGGLSVNTGAGANTYNPY